MSYIVKSNKTAVKFTSHFLQGVGSVICIIPAYNRRKQDDMAALQSDWAAIGNDFKTAMCQLTTK